MSKQEVFVGNNFFQLFLRNIEKLFVIKTLTFVKSQRKFYFLFYEQKIMNTSDVF